MEAFCVILKRTMSIVHPLHQMLRYHCRDVTVPNTIGAPKLVNEGKFMDQLFAFGNNGTERLITDAHSLSTWDVTDFRNEIKVCDALTPLPAVKLIKIQNILITLEIFSSLIDMEVCSQ